ncbi:MAG TPA: hypothetical protein VF608_10255 [Thermoanaerobaculia bacterium]
MKKTLLHSTLVVCLSLSISAFAQETVSTVVATELPRATFTQLASLPIANVPRTVEQHGMLPELRIRTAGNTAPLPPLANATSSSIAPPAITRTFASGGEQGWAPADASGAVGKTHIVSALNSGIYIHDRSGAILSSASLPQFWHSTASNGSFYDPRVAYDRANDRWIVISVFDERSVMLAYSETSDPAGAWRRYSLALAGADYTTLALTQDTVMFTACYGDSYNEGTTVFSVQKDVLYTGASTVSVQKTHFSRRISIMPVRSDDSTTDYIVDCSNSTLFYRRLDATGESWQSISTDTAWYGDFLEVPQPTGPYLFAGWGQVDSAVEVNGVIYAVMSRLRAAETDRTSIVWAKFDPASSTSEWGSIDDPTATNWYAYPSLAVNKSGAMLIGFGIFSEAAYPSAGYVYRDFLGRTSSIGVIRTGDSAYGIERWGDYTSTDVDPLDANDFWTLQMHCTAKAWATSWTLIDTQSSKRRAVRN